MPLARGARLGPYEISGLLGAGGMGEVYRARDTRLHRDVAIKVIPQELADDEGCLRRFEQEARATAALNHPNILALFDVGVEGTVHYVVEELLEGETLRGLLAGGAIPMRKAIDYGAQIALGLDAAHGKGIVHRDLKPENLIVSKDGHLKILDFGLARLTNVPHAAEGGSELATMTRATSPGTVLGTVGYMSPEQASGQPLDHRSDQFSLGAILYELLTGERPFARKTAAETMAAIIREEPKPLAKSRPQTPLPLRWIVERCLAKEPEGRYVSTKDLARDLAGVRDHLSEIGSGGEEPPSPSPARSRAHASRWWAAAGALAAGLLGAWLAGWGLRRAPPAPSFHQLTFRQGTLGNARFAADGQTIVYGATWSGVGSRRLFQTRPESPESRGFDFGEADILAISKSAELAVLLGDDTLARVPLSGGAPRPVLKGVQYAGADWSPDGKGLAAIRNSEGRDRLEFPIGRVLFETDGALSATRFSPSGDQIAVWHREATRSVLLVPTSGGKPRVLSTGWSTVSGVPSWTPSGREIWFTASRDQQEPALFGIDQAGRERLIIRVPGQLELDDISAQGRVLLAHHTQTFRLKGRASSDQAERDLSWLDRSRPMDLSQDGKILIFSEGGEGGGEKGSIYMRGTDGSPAVRLGEGGGGALSPDGQWVAAVIPPGGGQPPKVTLLPTGAGEARLLPVAGLLGVDFPVWLPDGKALLFSGWEKGHLPRVYLMDAAAGSLRPITEEGVYLQGRVSPDGAFFVATGTNDEIDLFPVAGGRPQPVRGLGPHDLVRQWSADGGSLYVWERGETGKVFLLNPATGDRRLWQELHRASDEGITSVVVSKGGSAYAYQVKRTVSELYLVDGLQ